MEGGTNGIDMPGWFTLRQLETNNMLEIKYKDEDGDECLFITNHQYLWTDPEMAAEEIAAEEYRNGDLYEPSSWPRKYEIFLNGEWHSASVEMDYDPTFSASVNIKLTNAEGNGYQHEND